jgi:hypothetical protein
MKNIHIELDELYLHGGLIATLNCSPIIAMNSPTHADDFVGFCGDLGRDLAALTFDSKVLATASNLGFSESSAASAHKRDNPALQRAHGASSARALTRR